MAFAFPPGYGCESRLPTARSNLLSAIALPPASAAVTPCEYTHTHTHTRARARAHTMHTARKEGRIGDGWGGRHTLT
jgi:hypothetical protein